MVGTCSIVYLPRLGYPYFGRRVLTVSLTDDEVKADRVGLAAAALLRITGPVLLGLALLAVRGRVKR
jgi:hypothetical protein